MADLQERPIPWTSASASSPTTGTARTRWPTAGAARTRAPAPPPEATRPPRGSLGAQQRAFNAFRRLHNAERPHAALGGLTPASQYRPSPRPYPARLPPLEYPGHYLVKRVTKAGTFRFRDRLLFIAHALEQHHVGLEETGDGVWSIHLGPVPLARLDERDYVIRG